MQVLNFINGLNAMQKLLDMTFFVTMNICGFEIKCILNIKQTQNKRNIIKQTKSKLFFKNIRNDLLQKSVFLVSFDFGSLDILCVYV